VSIRDEVRASAAAHHDLGSGYDAAVAEGLVERIGEEIDRRVDARIYNQTGRQAPPPRAWLRREPVPGRVGFGAVVLGLGSMGMAIGATAAVLHPGDSPGQVSGGAAVLIALIWIVIGVVNVAYARRP
jgi:anti-sigma factor RsiW